MQLQLLYERDGKQEPERLRCALRFARWPWRAGGGDGNDNGNGNAPPARHRPGQCTAVEERTGVPLYLLLPDTLTTVRQCNSTTVRQEVRYG